MLYECGNCYHIGCKALATKFGQIVGLLSIPWGNTVYWNLLWGPMWLGKERKWISLGLKGVKVYLKSNLVNQ